MPRILVIDDDDMVRETLARMLARAGYQVEQGRDGRDGLRVLARGDIDLAVVDIIMPDKEGIETIIELRRDHPAVKIVAISGGGRSGSADFLELARKFGADASFPKPFEEKAFFHTIESLLTPA